MKAAVSATLMTLPRLGETMEEGRIVAWAKRPGERFRRGETLLDVETDKTVVEVPALTDGVLVRVLAEPGAMVAIDSPIAEIETAGPSAEPPVRTGVRSAPGARRLARRMGVPLDRLTGTGRLGRVTRADVLRAVPSSDADDGTTSIEIPNGRLNRQVWAGGQGTPVLLVHGFAGDLLTWSGLAAGLQRAGRTVIAIDLPGHGRSDAPGETVEALVGAVKAAVASAGVDRVHLVGHSLGGAVALLAALGLQERVEGLSLLAPVGFGTEIDQAFLDGMLGAATPAALARELAKLANRPMPVSDTLLVQAIERLGEPDRNRRLRALARHIARDGVQQIHVAPHLAELRCPSRILWGRDDGIVPWSHALAAPGRTALHLFRDAGHMAHWDQPDAVAALLAQPPR